MLLVVAVVIVFTVIKPKFEEISYYQNEMATYKTALDNIGRYNSKLQQLITQAESISSEKRANLFRYLPETIDGITISRDIENMVKNNGMILTEISTDEPQAVTASVDMPVEVMGDDLVADPAVEGADGVILEDSGVSAATSNLMAQEFSVTAFGTYDEMKAFLKDLERNVYPLRLTEFEFAIEEAGPLMQYTMTLETYAYAGNRTR